MNLIIVVLPFILNLIQTIHMTKNRATFVDELFHYDLDKNIKQFEEYLTNENMILEQIDDDMVQIGGYIDFIKSLDPLLPLQMDLQTQYFEKGVWHEGPMRLTEKNMCPELYNPARFWYNFTKLWTNCPPQEGYKLEIEEQIMTLVLDLPANLKSSPWKWYFLIRQGAPGFEKHKFGFCVHLEFYPV